MPCLGGGSLIIESDLVCGVVQTHCTWPSYGITSTVPHVGVTKQGQEISVLTNWRPQALQRVPCSNDAVQHYQVGGVPLWVTSPAKRATSDPCQRPHSRPPPRHSVPPCLLAAPNYTLLAAPDRPPQPGRPRPGPPHGTLLADLPKE